MIAMTQAFKNYVPFMLTGGGIGMLTNALFFEHSIRSSESIIEPDEEFSTSIKRAFNTGLVAIIFSNVMLGSAKLIAHLSLQHKQVASLNVIFKNIPYLLTGLNWICGYLSIVIKVVAIAERILFEKPESKVDVNDDEKEGWMTHVAKPPIEFSAFVLSGALGAAGAVLIHKYFPES
jgi:hypothetical protein